MIESNLSLKEELLIKPNESNIHKYLIQNLDSEDLDYHVKMGYYFSTYIATFPFKGEFVLSRFQSLWEDFDYDSFVSLRNRFYTKKNKKVVDEFTTLFDEKITNKNIEHSIKFNKRRDSLKRRFPLVEDMTNYIWFNNES